MRILFLTHYFPPEVNAPANRTFEHCREWVRLGHEVHVITCVPSHPRGVPFAGYRRGWHQRESVDGIQVHRVWTYLAANRGVVRRALNYLSYVPSAVWRALRLGRFDVIIATSPQFFCAVAGGVAGTLKRTPWVFELRDLWPDSISAVGALQQRAALRLLEKFELGLYRNAAMVVCVTRAFVENLSRRGIDTAKLEYIPNGVDVAFWEAGSAVRGRSLLGCVDGEVLVSYIGTVGLAHGIGAVIDAARLLERSHPEVRFIVVGDGADRDRLTQQVAAHGPKNLVFVGQVGHNAVRDFMAATEISLVVLKRSDLFLTVLPSKMFEAMGAAKPVVLGVGGEARTVLEASRGGIAVEPENPEAIAAAIGQLARDASTRRAMGERGKAFVQREFDRKVWAGRLLATLHHSKQPSGIDSFGHRAIESVGDSENDPLAK